MNLSASTRVRDWKSTWTTPLSSFPYHGWQRRKGGTKSAKHVSPKFNLTFWTSKPLCACKGEETKIEHLYSWYYLTLFTSVQNSSAQYLICRCSSDWFSPTNGGVCMNALTLLQLWGEHCFSRGQVLNININFYPGILPPTGLLLKTLLSRKESEKEGWQPRPWRGKPSWRKWSMWDHPASSHWSLLSPYGGVLRFDVIFHLYVVYVESYRNELKMRSLYVFWASIVTPIPGALEYCI